MLLASFVVLACAAGFALAWVLQASRSGGRELVLQSQLEALGQSHATLRAELSASRQAYAELTQRLLAESAVRAGAEERAALVPDLVAKLQERDRLLVEREKRISTLEAQLTEERRVLVEQRQVLEQAQHALTDSFKALSADALRSNNQAFIDLAKSALERFQDGAKGDLEARQKAVDELVRPLRESLQKVDGKLGDIERARIASYSSLNEQLRGLVETHLPGLRNETSNLVRALRQPATRGRWGEMQLRRVVEMAGMVDHCDFIEQDNRTTEDGRLRPDLVVRLPGGGNIIVDSKAPVAAYLDALEAGDEAAQRLRMRKYSQQVRNHMAALSRKAYWDQFELTPDFVVMFMPGEVFFSAALQEDPSLIEFGTSERVVPATPTTLIALLRTVVHGWRQEALAQNAKDIAKVGKELHERVATLAEHWTKMGKSLSKTVEAYNDATATLESRVLVSARRFRDLKVGAADTEVRVLEQLDRNPRLPQAEELVIAPVVSPVMSPVMSQVVNHVVKIPAAVARQ